ncbi:MAG: hypothetical protein IIY55_00840 [Blautia sp.]|nr:hypothetical protein [Blautia sp.]
MKSSRWWLLAGLVSALFLSGCDGSSLNLPMKDKKAPKASELVEPALDAEPPAPTQVPVTVTPKPTSTPAPRMLGLKTIQSKYIFLTNSTGTALREVYLKYWDEYEWGNNLVRNEATVRPSETVQMFFDKPSSDDVLYDMKFVDKSGNAYAIYNVPLTDMNSAMFHVREGTAYLSYMSLSEQKEVHTDGSETLATDYGSDTYSDDTSGNGYYDANGYWVTEYSEDTYGNGQTGDTDNGYYDIAGNFIPHGNSGNPYDDYMGDPRYGYWDNEGIWVMY